MTALTKEKIIRNLRARWFGEVTLPVKAGEVIYPGAAVAAVDGEWQNVTATTGLQGRTAEAEHYVDNTDEGKVLTAKFWGEAGKWLTPFYNDPDAPVLAKNMGDEVFWRDNQTVSMDGDPMGSPAADTRSICGRVWKFADVRTFDQNTNIVWVEVY